MNREEAIARLDSAVPAERLEAARYLQFWAVAADIPTLRGALSRETVGWIHRAIESTLARLGDVIETEIDLGDYLQDDDESSREVASLARGMMARTLVHELEPIVGTIQYYASSEMGQNYAESRTRDQIDRLGRFLRAVEKIGKVIGSAKNHRFDLASLLVRLIDAEQVSFEAVIRMSGSPSAVVVSDAGLVEIIVSNALRNAAESVQESSVGGEIVVVYGVSDRDFWITIKDSGGGLPSGSTERLFDLGATTKDGHLGMGLTVSVEAAHSLGGRIRLAGSPEGAQFELVCPLGRVQ